MKKKIFISIFFSLFFLTYAQNAHAQKTESAEKSTEKNATKKKYDPFKKKWSNEALSLSIRQSLTLDNITKERKNRLVTQFIFTIKKEFHINATEVKDSFFIATKANIFGEKTNILQIKASPPSEKIVFGRKWKIYEKGPHTITIHSTLPPPKTKQFFTFTYQACGKKNCFPPEKLSFSREVGEEEEYLAIENIDENIAEDGTFTEKTAGEKTSNTEKDSHLLISLLFAFLGGVILNFMPCVLPAVSLKILSLLQLFPKTEKKSIHKIKKMAISYFLGIFCVFFLLASVIALLHQQSWGFQFQYPLYLTIMAGICWILGLEMSGISTFSYRLPAIFSPLSKKISGKKTYFNHFFSGIFFVLLSTPCIAPFLATAMTYAFQQTLTTIYLLFFSISLGFSLPFILIFLGISSRRIQKILPQSGKWTEKLKQWLSLPMFGTALWLYFILLDHTDIVNDLPESTTFLSNQSLIILLVSILAATIIIPSMFQYKKKTLRLQPSFFIVIASGFALFSFLTLGTKKKSVLHWQKFNAETINAIEQRQNITLVHIGAKWCITCVVNELNVLEKEKTKRLLKRHNVKLFYGDWTKKDENIANYIKKVGAVGIPLDIIYPKNRQKKPIILPSIFSFDELKQALQKAQ